MVCNGQAVLAKPAVARGTNLTQRREGAKKVLEIYRLQKAIVEQEITEETEYLPAGKTWIFAPLRLCVR